ncbi:TetR/AcrR family transcriptional regulator [Sinosporangium siamense]|uniref:TetR family transcriptional regulator n=1 Tax=Sinosporangium siamense TaxID=1367973 RepID=A0A919V5C3_9ACTN|nr:TetR/AcrR family transcriptional regulator [Sinosporangium siamense]GII89777.1 TetR family transcriptional regulator [Sinosporangium siamense]
MTETPKVTTVWFKDTAKGSRPKRTGDLSREQIVRAAVEILDNEGIDALSMRRLGAKLGAGATSIYWHVATKSDLLDLATDEILGEIEIPEEGDWQLRAGIVAYNLRTTLMRHRWAPGLMTTRPNIGPHAMDLTEQVLSIFLGAGFSPVDASMANSTITGYVLGLTVGDAAWDEVMAASNTAEQDWLDKMVPFLQQMMADRPTLKAVYLGTRGSMDSRMAAAVRFEFGLQCILDGLAARLDRPCAGQAIICVTHKDKAQG